MRACGGYLSTWTFVADQIAHKKPREDIIQGLVQAGYTKQQAQKTYVSYRNRYFKIIEHMNGRHNSLPAQCDHWVPKGFVRKTVDIMPPKDGDIYQAHKSEDPSDWLSWA